MRRVSPAALVLLLLAHAAGAAPLSTRQWLLEQVKVLSAPEMEGRASGTAGAERAAAHIEGVFRAAGLRPGGDAGGYRQAFTVPTGIRLGPRNALAVPAAGASALVLGQDWAPLPVSGDGAVEGEMVFAGFGITAPDLGYDDYAGLDVRGKVVLVVSGEPRTQDPASPFRRPEAYHYGERSHKVINAREHGARAILLVEHPGSAREHLPALVGISQSWDIPAAALTRKVVEAVLTSAGSRLAELVAAIDQGLTPHSRLLTGVAARLEITLVRDRGTAANLVAVLPGTDPVLREEEVVVGAHYDHLGHGGEGSLAPDEVGAVHHGADDNASGVAVLLGLARAFAAGGGAPRTLVFVAFAGEEMGLMGSTHYVKHPWAPSGRTVLMVNLDMVGRLREGRLYVAGVDSGTFLRPLVAAAAHGLALSPVLQGDPYGPSDHTSFYTGGRPVLFLFTGAHPDYHRPSDTWDRINTEGLEVVTGFTHRLVAAVAGQPVAPSWVRIEAPAARGPRASGYGPYFGIIPEFGDTPLPGVRISGVRAGSPAEKAGIVAGDLIVRFGDVAVKTLSDLTFVLRSKRPGDRVEVVVLRGEREARVEAILEERRR